MVTPFASGVGFTVSGKWDLPEGQNTTFADQVGNILAGQTYMNFHTVQFGSGEVRGQILVVPEPETYLLMLAGLAGIGRDGSPAARRADRAGMSPRRPPQRGFQPSTGRCRFCT